MRLCKDIRCSAQLTKLIVNRPPGASGGMNIAQGTYLGPGNLSMVVTDMWYNGEVTLFPAYGVNDLDVSASSDFQKWGHFSQVVWGSSQSVGCGSASCGAGTSIGSGYFVACMYYPPGQSFTLCYLIEVLDTKP